MLDPMYWERVRRAWVDFVPSTHHDYICGTAPDWVTKLERLPLLRAVCAEASIAADQALLALATSIDGAAGDVLVINPSGVPFSGLVELPAPVERRKKSIDFSGHFSPVQYTADGGLAFLAKVPSMAYTTASLAGKAAKAAMTVSIEPTKPGESSYTLTNEFMTVVISAEANWGISSISNANGNPLLAANSVANDLVFYNDGGNLYQFGNEVGDGTAFASVSAKACRSGPGKEAYQVELGPVFVRLLTEVCLVPEGPETVSGGRYLREYCLVAGEPLLRMSTRGTAPSGYSVMAAFPLTTAVDSITYGTPCHWTAAVPNKVWSVPVFRPAHNFLLAQSNGSVAAAIYPVDVPAWAYDERGVLIGCLLRNTPARQRAAYGSDPDVHTLRYAFRVPNGVADPSTGLPLQEALNYTAPAVARRIPGLGMEGATLPLPASGFIASVSLPGVIQAAKPGDVDRRSMILRIYQGSNSTQTLTVTLGAGKPATVTAVTALEDPILNGGPAIQITENGFTIEVASALNTVQITF